MKSKRSKIKKYKSISLIIAFMFVLSLLNIKEVKAEGVTAILTKIGGFSTGYSNENGGVAEIVKYNKDNNKFYVIDGMESIIHVVSLDNITGKLEQESKINVKEFVEKDGFKYGDITSISISNIRKEIAVSVQEQSYDKAGKIVILNYDGSLKKIYDTGIQPDMLIYSPNSKYILTANEGEPRMGYGEDIIDPMGTITVVNLETGTVNINTFEKYDTKDGRDNLLNNKVILKKGAKPSEDLEPEYITIDSESKYAYVSLQEANSIAKLDIETGELIYVKGLGFKDYSKSGNEIDVVSNGKIDIKSQNNLYGVYMPDGVTSYEVDGVTYLLTANEGDSRSYVTEDFPQIANENQFTNEKKIEIEGKKVTALNQEVQEGLDLDKNYIFGGRSFSVWRADTLEQVFDSGSDFEKITSEKYPEYFNTSNNKLKLDDRSGKKGPEPEEVRVGKVGDKLYAFIGLERIGGVMTYDITNPNSIKNIDYLNTRDFSAAIAGDVAPEGMDFIPASISPTNYPLVLVANEVSGTVSVLQVNEGFEKKINIFHTNDTHSRVDNFPKMKAYINNFSNSLLLDAGDTFHGQSFATLEKGSSIAKVMNAMGYAAMVPGNHDFNYGKDRLRELGAEAGVDILATNIKESGKVAYKDYTIKEIDGVKVGIFGLATPETTYKTNPLNVSGLDFGNKQTIINDAQETVNNLKEQGANVIIALSHLGIDGTSEVKSTDIGEKVTGIDIIIDGHSHSTLDKYAEFNKNHKTQITSTGEYLNNFGSITLDFNEKNELQNIRLKNIDTTTLSEEDSSVKAVIDNIKERQQPILDVVVGKTPILLDGAREHVRFGHTNLGRLITTAMLKETGADIAITNGGGIRDSIQAGDITKGDVIKVLPFGNFIVTKRVKGEDIISALNHGMVVGAGSFTQFAGMDVKAELYTDAGGIKRYKVASVTVNGKKLDPNKEYVVATNDFMAVGGDGYEMLKKYPTLNEYSALDEVFINYMSKASAEDIIRIDKEVRLQQGTAEDNTDNDEKPNVDSGNNSGNNNSNNNNNSSNNKEEGKLPNTGGTNTSIPISFAAVITVAGVVLIRKNMKEVS